jgi:hypothetical protein
MSSTASSPNSVAQAKLELARELVADLGGVRWFV